MPKRLRLLMQPSSVERLLWLGLEGRLLWLEDGRLGLEGGWLHHRHLRRRLVGRHGGRCAIQGLGDRIGQRRRGRRCGFADDLRLRRE